MAYTHQDSSSDAVDPTTLAPLPLPSGLRSRYIDCTPNSLVFHIIESLPANPSPSTKLILCVHGFPELAYSWRKILPLLSDQGYHAVAFDQRGYGRTHSPTPLPSTSFRPLNLLKDTVALVSALGYTSVSAVVGHDFGAVTAYICALARPDLFKSLVLMSHPSKGAPTIPFSTDPSLPHQTSLPRPAKAINIQAELASLPRPRKHYKWYYCTEPANDDMTYPTGKPLHEFYRGYFHLKSADWPQQPHPLKEWSAEQLQVMPRYYIMDRDGTMRDNVALDMAPLDPQEVKKLSDRWLPDEELAVYVQECEFSPVFLPFPRLRCPQNNLDPNSPDPTRNIAKSSPDTRTTFRGGLNWYGLQTSPEIAADTAAWAGRKVEVPTVFVVGRSDWGTYQEPGALEAMETGKSVEKAKYRGSVFVEGAGHWVNQERPHECAEKILELAKEVEELATARL